MRPSAARRAAPRSMTRALRYFYEKNVKSPSPISPPNWRNIVIPSSILGKGFFGLAREIAC
jgi:hypothetical protein